jgi:DNA-binding response OmpR family regulator/DNA-binding CsgD family transcriptional regulator
MKDIKRKSILVVDDTPENLRLLTGVLAEQGYRVRAVSNGKQALSTIQKEPPDLILLDIMMPDMNGYEVCQQLKSNEQTRDIPVIFISALDEIFDKMTAFSIGGVDYITKPFQVEELLARVNTHLTLRRLQEELQDSNQALQAANESLEEKVQLRTAELAEMNKALKAEIEQRIRQQEEKDRLFNVVSQQSEQLRNLTNLLLETQQQQHQGVVRTLHNRVEQNLALLDASLKHIRQLLTQNQADSQVSSLITDQLNEALETLARAQQQTYQVTDDLDRASSDSQSLRANPLLNLSTREREVLQLLVAGKSTTEIADILIITKTTVSTYRQRIMQKLDIYDMPGLVKFAIQHNLTSLQLSD